MDSSGSTTVRKLSLFAQRMKNAKEAKLRNSDECGSVSFAGRIPGFFGEKSNVVSGPEAEEIHKENSLRLAAMTKEEIEAERNKLLAEMDPELIEFLRSRKNKPSISSSSIDNHKNKVEKDCKPDKDILCKQENEEKMETEIVAEQTVAHELSKQWPNMGNLEQEKVKWMEDLPNSKPLRPDEPYNARFSFYGTLLPYIDDKMDVREGLHHHGEEPERPGYTLQELIQLSRSSVLQQRIIALNTLANILKKANIYVECFDKPLLPMLLDAELFLMLRFSLDDASRPIITASLAALCSLLFNHSDEFFLDTLLGCHGGLHQPSLHVELDLKQNEIDELKDPELLRLDVIRGALRTHLLPRFRYILEKMNPESTEVVHIIKCLLRIARHSYEASLSIVSCPGLLECVRRTLMKDCNNCYPDALKLLRVIACRTENFACLIMEKYSIMDVILQIIAGEAKENQPEAMRLMVESFYLWQTLLSFNLASDHIAGFIPVLSRLLCVHIEHTGIESSVGDQEHAVALVSTLATAFKISYSRVNLLLQPIIQATLKWTSQIINKDSFSRSMCKLVGAALSCLAVAMNIEAIDCGIEVKLENYFRCSLFTKAISLLRKHSWLLNVNIDNFMKNTTENLPSLAAKSPTNPQYTLPLFEGLAAFVLAAQKYKLSDLFLKNPAWENYLQTLIRTEKLGQVSSHWFARQEVRLLCALLFININTQTFDGNFIHQVALILATIIHTDEKLLLSEILQKIIFNQQYFTKHIVTLSAQIEDLQLENNAKINTFLLEGINNLVKIKQYYEVELGLIPDRPSSLPPLTLTSSDKGCEPALPSDWQFLPILRLYNTEGKGDDAVNVATCSLQWVLILEHFQPSIADKTPITARFSRLCCLFMAGNDLFRDVGNLLKEVLRILMSKNQDLDLDNPVPGLNSFYDFYRQLVDHYVAVSYGDPIFGLYVLTPLQQRYNVKFRKLIWSEQAPLVRVLSTPLEQMVIPLREFLEPCETDIKLLATYLQFLATGKIRPQWSPVLYKISIHHVSTFIRDHPENNFAKSVLQRIEALGNQELRTLLLNYSGVHQN